MSHIRAFASHGALAVLEAGIIALLILVLIVAPALAAKGGNGGGKTEGGTISLVLMDGATEAHFGARVTFDVSTQSTPYPYVHLMCYQGGTLVAEGRQGFFETALGNQWFTLGPTPAWQGGSATCTAKLEQWTKRGWSVLASTTFAVDA